MGSADGEDVEPDVGSSPDDEVQVVRREGRQPASDAARRRRLALISGGALLALVVIGAVVFALTRGEEEPAATTTTSTTTMTTTTVAGQPGPVAPLTGLEVDSADGGAVERLNRPALVGKIDNDPAAMPQIGLDRADVVIELKVEGISRFMAVVHSQEVQQLGPIRSARTSDPDLLAMFGRPLVAWSGGNPTVTRIMNSTPWIQSLNPDQTSDAYSRTRTKKAPHNLVVDVGRIYTYADEPPAVPAPLFGYLTEGADPGGVPVAGFDLMVGSSPSTYVWSQESSTWLRWANLRPQVAEDGNRIAPANVVVLATPYTTSTADRLSPEAQTIGSGTAWVFTQGRMIEGRWERTEVSQPWQLSLADGSPMLLTPGSTWVQLPSPDSGPRPFDAGRAATLLAG